MVKYAIPLGLMLLFGNQAWSAGNVTNFQAKGNLAATKPVGCVTLDKLDNTFTPADLYPAVASCIRQGDYDNGAQLFAIAGVFGRFDVYRVADKTSHQGLRVLLINTFGPLDFEKKQAFQKTLQIQFKKDSKSLRNICNKIDKIGHPGYYPKYMIMHGMNAITGNPNKDVMVKDFNAKHAWMSALDTYLHCPVK